MTQFPRLVLAATLATSLVVTAPAVRADAAADPLAESYRLQTKNDLAGAIKATRKAIDATPSAYFPRIRLAYLDTLAGDWTGAAAAYHSAGELAPGAVEPLLGEQLALNALGKWDEAEGVGKRVLAIDPLNYLGRSRQAWSKYKRKDFRGAAEVYAALVALYPGDIDMRVGLGWSLLGLGRKPDAAAAFREVLTMVPGLASASEGLAASK
jgi:tetratricopeptide (TPR) repeat protein